uniref:ZP domain-containing protein n=1 Tax=Panagrellus redivivus TaxID=6233 RepID=A0A7E4VWE9_PANRE
MLSIKTAFLLVLPTIFGANNDILVNDGGMFKVKNTGEGSIIPYSSNFTLRFYKSDKCDLTKDFEFCYSASSSITIPTDCGDGFRYLSFRPKHDCIVVNGHKVRFENNEYIDCFIKSESKILCGSVPILTDVGKFKTETSGSIKIKVMEFTDTCPVSIFGAVLHFDSPKTAKADDKIVNDESNEKKGSEDDEEDHEENVLENSISLWYIATFLFLTALLIIGIGFGVWGIKLFLQHRAENRSHNTPPSLPTKTPKNAVPLTAVTTDPTGIGPEDTLIPPSLDGHGPKPKKTSNKEPKFKLKQNNKSSDSKEHSEVMKLPQSSTAAPASSTYGAAPGKKIRPLGDIKQQKPK